MDVISSVAAVVGLVFNFATAAKTCNDIRGRYNGAERTIDSLKHELETLQGALQELANLMMHDASALTSRWDTNKTLSRTFARATKGFERTIKGLQAELEELKGERREITRLEKVKVLWNEDGMRQHLDQLRGQAGALQLLLQVLHTGAISEFKNELRNVEAALLQLSISSNAEDINDDERLPEYRVAQANDQKHDLNLSSFEEIPGDACLNEENRLIYSETLEASSICRLSGAQDNSSGDHSPSTTPQINNGVIPPGPVNASDQETSLLAEEVQSDDKIPNETAASETIPEAPVRDRSSITQMPEGGSEVPELIREVIRGNLQKVTELLDSGHEPDCRHPSNDRTGVVFAAMLSHHNILALLLDRGASISAKDKQGRTALHYAASEGYRSAELLLSREAPVNTKDAFHEVPLHRACRYGNVSIVKLLLPHYPDPLEYIDGQGRNALHLALYYNQDEATEAICKHIQTIKHFEDCSAKSSEGGTSSRECSCPATYPRLEDEDFRGRTALQLGLHSHRALSALIRFATPNLDVPTRMTKITSTLLFASTPFSWCRPLHLALKGERVQIMQLLVDGGADVNLPDCIGQTPLMDAVHSKREERAKFLLAHGVEYSTLCPKHQDMTILHEAVESFSPTILEQIDVSNPCNSMSTARGRLLFQEAQSNQRWDIIKTLIEKCPEKDCIGNILDEELTLKHSLSASNGSLVEYLILSGANPNAKSFFKDGLGFPYAIHFAAERFGVDNANALLKGGADILLEDCWSQRPCHVALTYNEPNPALWFVEETIAKIRKTSKPGEIAGAIESILVRCMECACGAGSLEKIDGIFNVGMRELDKDLRKGNLHLTVKLGRVDATKHLLTLGFDLAGAGGEGRFALETDFYELKPHGNMPSNNIADHHECRELVREAISLQKARTAVKRSKRKKR